jgi:S1/P1 Nuclease
MKKISRLIASSLVLIFALSVSSYGWSDTGHMAVAFVAYNDLTPRTRDRVEALLRLNPRFNIWLGMIPPNTSPENKRMMLFMIAATWPDQIKSDGQHHSDGPDGGNRPPTDGTADRNFGYSDSAMHKYWHFIDLPFSPDGTALENPSVPNALTRIATFRSTLASTSSDKLKSYDLVWLLHLVGDVHQPLHCTSRFTHNNIHGDAGGNSVTVRNGSRSQSLHSFWDGILGTSSDPRVAASVGQSLAQADATLADQLDPRVWINESFAAAKSTVYLQPPIGVGTGTSTITATYRNTATALAKERVALAGARLGRIINRELR